MAFTDLTNFSYVAEQVTASNIATARTLKNLAKGQPVFISGADEAGDGGGGFFVYDPDTVTDDGIDNLALIHGGSLLRETIKRGDLPYVDVREFGSIETPADATLTIQAAIDALAPSSTPIIVPHGLTQTNSSLVIKSGLRLIIAGEIQSTANAVPVFTDNNVAVSDVQIKGGKITTTGTGAVLGILLDADTASQASEILIDSVEFDGVYRGIGIHRGQDITVRNCVARDLSSVLLYVGQSVAQGRSSRIRFFNNRSYNCGTATASADSSLFIAAFADDVLSMGNVSYSGGAAVHVNLAHSIYYRSCRSAYMIGDRSYGQRGGAAFVAYSAGGEIRCNDIGIIDCVADDCPEYSALRADAVDGLRIRGGSYSRSGSCPIYISSATDVDIDGVLIEDGNRLGLVVAFHSAGIVFYSVSDWRIRSVTVNGLTGVSTASSTCLAYVEGTAGRGRIESSRLVCGNGLTGYQFLHLASSSGRIKMRGISAFQASTLIGNPANAAAGSEMEDAVAEGMGGAWSAPSGWQVSDILYNTVQQVASKT